MAIDPTVAALLEGISNNLENVKDTLVSVDNRLDNHVQFHLHTDTHIEGRLSKLETALETRSRWGIVGIAITAALGPIFQHFGGKPA